MHSVFDRQHAANSSAEPVRPRRLSRNAVGPATSIFDSTQQRTIGQAQGSAQRSTHSMQSYLVVSILPVFEDLILPPQQFWNQRRKMQPWQPRDTGSPVLSQLRGAGCQPAANATTSNSRLATCSTKLAN